MAQHGVNDIDKFRELVSEASTKRRRSYDRLIADDDVFADAASELNTISRLTDELSIVALYRVVEVVRAKMLIHDLGAAVTGWTQGKNARSPSFTPLAKQCPS